MNDSFTLVGTFAERLQVVARLFLEGQPMHGVPFEEGETMYVAYIGDRLYEVVSTDGKSIRVRPLSFELLAFLARKMGWLMGLQYSGGVMQVSMRGDGDLYFAYLRKGTWPTKQPE